MNNEDLNLIIARNKRFLPNVRPLQNFLHLSLYPDYIEKDFFQSLKEIGSAYSTIPFLELSYYQNLFQKGEITRSHINHVLKNASPEKQRRLQDILFRNNQYFLIPEKGQRPLHRFISEKLGQSINELTEPILIRFLSNYFDQGISHWSMPFINEGLLHCFIQLNTTSLLPIYPMTKSALEPFVGQDSVVIINSILNKIFDNEGLYETYLQSSLLSLKGWAGFVKTIETNPDLLVDQRKCSLNEYIAIRLIIDYCWILKLNSKILPITQTEADPYLQQNTQILTNDEFESYEIWQRALEESLIQKTVSEIKEHQIQPHEENAHEAQAVFCIDDRECLLRRNIELIAPTIQTFGTPGHFGLDFMYKEHKKSFPIKSCPPPVKAQFEILNNTPKEKYRHYQWQNNHNQNIFEELIVTFKDGIKSFLNLFFKTFIPIKLNKQSPLKITKPMNLAIFNSEFGYNFDQAADRVASVLTSINLVADFSDTLFIVGHGSTTTNNPYYVAYGCGACSGRDGDVNANAFVTMVNHSEVRSILLSKYKINIPDKTTFIACFHDTTSEEIHIYLPDHLSQDPKIQFYRAQFEKVLLKNALERVSDFKHLENTKNPLKAQQKLRERAHAIFEPRPELGHTNNALTVIGDRSKYQGLSFKRRAFLQSYKPEQDTEGFILESILGATIPVCGGISLDYLFSRLNNRDMAAGSKLSHNVIGLIGVSHGSEDDLLAGLPQQMVEMHIPCRNIFFIDQSPKIIQKVFQRNQHLASWVNNGWIRVCCCDPLSGVYYVHNSNFFERLGII